MKNRKVKMSEYEEKYSDIPIDLEQRLSWMFDKYRLSNNKCNSILEKRNSMLASLFYYDINIILFEEPEGSKRPRTRLVNRKNFINESIKNPNFIHVYVPDAKEDNLHMKRVVEEQELLNLEQLICTPCIAEYNSYLKTPSSFNIEDTFLAEIGLIRPIVKPDWDNLGKKYSDMSNQNLWLDDSFVITGIVNKYHSILPRIEIKIRFLNMIYNKYQYNMISKRRDFIDNNCQLNYFKEE